MRIKCPYCGLISQATPTTEYLECPQCQHVLIGQAEIPADGHPTNLEENSVIDEDYDRGPIVGNEDFDEYGS